MARTQRVKLVISNYNQLFKCQRIKCPELKGIAKIWGNPDAFILLFFIVFQTSLWTAVSCLTKERQTVESMLSSQTNLSHSMFTAKWVQVGETKEIPVLIQSVKNVSVFKRHRHGSLEKDQKPKCYQARQSKNQVSQKHWKWGGHPIHIIYDKEASWSLCELLYDLNNGNLIWYAFLINYIDGGSTVIQRRVDGSVDFDQTWNKYETGFGDLESEYFSSSTTSSCDNCPSGIWVSFTGKLK